MQHEIIVNAAAQHGRDVFDALTLVIGALGLYILGRYTNHAKHQKEAAQEANRLATRAAEEEGRRNRDALELARKSTEIANRAWLLATGALSGQLVVGSQNRIAVMIEHLGGVPAIDIKVEMFYGLGEDLPTEWRGAQQLPNIRGALGGRAGLECVGFVGFQDWEFRRVEAGELWIKISAKYSDIFRRREPTIAVWRYNARNYRWAVISHDIDMGSQEPS